MPIAFPDSLKGLTLWRYMGIEKLLDLLQTRSLYFPQLTCFRDPYEGWVPTAWEGDVMDVSQLPHLLTSDGRPDWQEVRFFPSGGQYLRDVPAELYVSCWHNNPHESAAMWSLYSSTNGLVIKTTSDRLADAFNNCEPQIELVAVEYVEIVPGLLSGRPWSLKRPSFQHENEIRAVIRDPGCKQPGLRVPVDLEVLIQEVYLSPESDSWILPVVKGVTANYGLHKNVKRSELWELK